MAGTTTRVAYAARLEITDVPNTVPGGVTAAVVYTDADVNAVYNASNLPAPTKTIVYEQDITSGLTVDLTGGQGLTGTIDLTGKKLQFLRVVVPADAPAALVITKGASQGYELGATDAKIVVPIGGDCVINFKDKLTAVDGSHYKILFAGTTGTIPTIVMVFT